MSSDPLHEDGAMALMRVQALGGARHMALRRYRLLEESLREDLGIDPGEPIRSLHEAILAGRYPAAAALPGSIDGLHSNGSLLSEEPPPAAEERRLVTVLWAEPVVPTGDPELARGRLMAWTELVAEVLEGWGASADPQAGGSVVAVFGVPKAHEDDAARALRAGLEIVERAPLPTHAGVATGEVIAEVGERSGPRTVAGDVVVVAGRLREAAEIGAVLVADRTRRAAGEAFRYAEDGTRRAGHDRSGAHRLLEEERVPRARPRDEPPLIGRESELLGVLGLFDETVQTRPAPPGRPGRAGRSRQVAPRR